MGRFRNMFLFMAIMVMAFGFTSASLEKNAVAKDTFKVAWSHYTGWEPVQYLKDSGILAKWAKKYGVTIEVSAPMDYMESLNQFAAGQYDGVVATNMDALTVPAVGGVDTEVIVIGDYSWGNDGVCTYSGKDMKDMKGRKVKLVQFSVSHYLLSRCLQMAGMKETDVSLVNVSDADIPGIFTSDRSPDNTVVTWNPILMNIRQEPGAVVVCDSAKIPGEIMDLTVVRTDSDPRFKKAWVGAWFEAIGQFKAEGAMRAKVVGACAKSAGGTVAEFERQLKTTFMFYTPKDAYDFTVAPKLKEIMEFVRTFCFDHGLYNKTAKTKDDVGIAFPDGTVMGDKKNVKLRFNAEYMKMAMEGKL